MNNIIFLDFDGVLCLHNYINEDENLFDQYGLLFNKEWVKNLESLIEFTQAKLVISSNWRMGKNLEYFQKMWEDRNLPGEIIGLTPYFSYSILISGKYRSASRGYEIDVWIQENKEKVKEFLILDDESYDILLGQKNNFIHCFNKKDVFSIEGYGFTSLALAKAIKKFQKLCN